MANQMTIIMIVYLLPSSLKTDVNDAAKDDDTSAVVLQFKQIAGRMKEAVIDMTDGNIISLLVNVSF